MEKEYRKFLVDMESHVLNIQLAMTNAYKLIGALDQWTKDHVCIEEMFYTPFFVISMEADKIMEEYGVLLEKARAAK